MHSKNVQEAVSPRNAAFRAAGGAYHCADEDTRRYWRKTPFKRNGGRKAKSLRSHRKGK